MRADIPPIGLDRHVPRIVRLNDIESRPRRKTIPLPAPKIPFPVTDSSVTESLLETGRI